MSETAECLQAETVIAHIKRIQDAQEYVELERLIRGLERLEGGNYASTDEVIALVKQLGSKGYLEKKQLIYDLYRFDRISIVYPSIFDALDAEKQDPSWPPTGRWDDAAKQVTEVASEDIEGVL